MLKRKINLQPPAIRRAFLPLFEDFTQLVLDQKGASKDEHELEYWSAQQEVVFNDFDDAVGDNCDLELYAHRILELFSELFDTEMPFDPFEEFHLPEVSVEQCNELGCKVKIVCDVNKRTSKVCCTVNDSPKFGRLFVEVPFSYDLDRLIEKQAVLSIEDVLFFKHLVFELTFLPYDEERVTQMDGEQTGEVKVSLLEDILSCMHKKNEFESVAKMQISNRGLGVWLFSNCA